MKKNIKIGKKKYYKKESFWHEDVYDLLNYSTFIWSVLNEFWSIIQYLNNYKAYMEKIFHDWSLKFEIN